MLLDFNQYAQEGNAFMNDLARELGYPDDRARAARVFKAVIHSLRDIVPVKENLQLLSQLPMFLKGVYVDGWTGEKADRIRDMERFIARVREHTIVGMRDTMAGQEEVWDRSIAVVFIALRRYVSLGELEDIKAVLPKDLKQMVEPVSLF